MRRFVLALVVLSAAGAAGAQEKPLTPLQAEGKALYDATCIYCHNARGYGTEAMGLRLGADKAELEKRTDLQPAYIRAVVKRGFNNMPAYTPTDLNDAQLDAIVAYLRRNSPAR